MRDIRLSIGAIIGRETRNGTHCPGRFDSDMEASAYIRRGYKEVDEMESALWEALNDLENDIMEELDDFRADINSMEDVIVNDIVALVRLAATLRRLRISKAERRAKNAEKAYERPSFLKDNEAVKTAIREYTLTINKLEEGDK